MTNWHLMPQTVTLRIFLIITVLVFGIGLFVTYSDEGFPLECSNQNRLVLGIGRDFFDGPDSRTYLHGSTNTWEALTYLNQNLQAEPWLAESWKSLDGGKIWSFIIRHGVLFHDGSPLTSREAVASLERIKAKPKYDPTGIYRNVLSIESRGEREVVFHLKAPSPSFPNLVAYYSSPIIHPRVFDSRKNIKELISTGPFKVEKVRRGVSIELSSFNDYWGIRPNFHKVMFRTILDAGSRIMALMAGELDAIADVGGILPEQAFQLALTRGIVLKRQEVATTHYLFFNCQRYPFSQEEARLWMASILDRKKLVDALAGGCGKVAKDLYSSLARDWAFGIINPPPGKRPSKPDRPLVIIINSNTTQRWPYLEIAQVIQKRLSTEGFPACIRLLETGPYQEALKQKDFDLLIQPSTLMTGDPDFFFSYYLASYGSNNFGFRDQQVDRIINEARHEMDPIRRKSLYRRLIEMVNRSLPVLPLYHEISLYAHKECVSNFQMDHNFRPVLCPAKKGGGSGKGDIP